MNTYRIADITVRMDCSGETLSKQAEPYQTAPPGQGDRAIEIDCERLKNTKGTAYPQLTLNEWEYIQAGFAFYQGLLDFDGFCLHASAVALENRAVLFSGPCATGKSTHAELWQKYFGPDRAVIINDDKPALRLMEGAFYVYGTPWSGKSSLNTNIRVPLQAIIFLKQAAENQIRCLNNKEAVQMLIYQSLRPSSDRAKMGRLLTLLDALLKKTPVYQMDCTISIDAVMLAYDTINSGRKATG